MKSKKQKKAQQNLSNPTELPQDLAYVQEAEICCEQARAAARLKRLKAAYGLFSTAQALLTRAVDLGGDACTEARERLNSISCEMAAYGELAKSSARPLRQSKIPQPQPIQSQPIQDQMRAQPFAASRTNQNPHS